VQVQKSMASDILESSPTTEVLKTIVGLLKRSIETVKAHGNFTCQCIFVILNDRIPSSNLRLLLGLPKHPSGYINTLHDI
jgi:hypothetical protein